MYTLNPLEYLDSLLIDYTLHPHATSFTAQETAAVSHIKGLNLAKVTVVGNEQNTLMVVIPASFRVNIKELSRMLSAPDLRIVPEYQFRDRFPECEIGAMPPFGRLYEMDVLIARELARQPMITFNAGTHNLLLSMRTEDYLDISDARTITKGYAPEYKVIPARPEKSSNEYWWRL